MPEPSFGGMTDGGSARNRVRNAGSRRSSVSSGPTAMLRSTALLLRHGLARPEEADALTHAIDVALASTPTADLGGTATTADFGKKIREQLVAGGTPTVVR